MEEKEDEITMIQLRRTTAQRIKQSPLAQFGDSYEMIINKALDNAEKKK